MLLINLQRDRLRYGLPRQPRSGVPDRVAWRPFARLYRTFPAPHSPGPYLHRIDYAATPTRVTPVCRRADGGGPYGRVEWHRTDRIRPGVLCEVCFPNGAAPPT